MQEHDNHDDRAGHPTPDIHRAENHRGNTCGQHIEQATTLHFYEDEPMRDVPLLLDDSAQLATLLAVLDDPEPLESILALIDADGAHMSEHFGFGDQTPHTSAT